MIQLPIRNIILLFLGLFATSLSKGQDAKIREIEQEYASIQRNIAKNEYYLNEIKINSQRFSLHQPGNFQKIIKFYYSFDKRQPSVQKSTLKSVVLVKEKNDSLHLFNYVYEKDGSLIFFKELVGKDLSKPDYELRIYISENNILKWLEKPKTSSAASQAKDKKLAFILDESKKFWDTFEKQQSYMLSHLN